MKVSIFSREVIQTLINGLFPSKTAVVSFYTPPTDRKKDYVPVDYCNKPDRLFYVCAHDIDIDTLPRYGLTYDTYMPDADALAHFIKSAVKEDLDIICQCDYGQSRSAACAAAILEYYEKNGITIFADYRYYPNQLVFNKVLNALRETD